MKTSLIQRGLIVLSILMLVLAAFPALAQQQITITDDDVNAIAKQMYCPVCENIPLDVCGTAACDQWRGEIRTQLEDGRTADQIIADFVNRFGERVVGTPQDPLLRSLSLVTPWIIGLVVIVIAGWNFARWRKQSRAALRPAGVTPDTDNAYRERLEADLKTRR